MSQNLADIVITTKTVYLPKESDPSLCKYVFAYFITIQNNRLDNVQLLTRHWIITDANNVEEEVKGEGVVGEQPFIQAGKSHEYNSYTIIKTPVGSMRGSYQFRDENGQFFDASIPAFSLAIPRILN